MSKSYDALACATEHPNAVSPYLAVFNNRSFEALSGTSASVDVVAPTPFAPPVGPYSTYRHIPKTERLGSYVVHHPRFLYAMPKRWFYNVSGDSLAKRLPRYIERTFDVPDVVHTGDIYLDGYGALPYCRRHDLPLFVTAHGWTLRSYDDFGDSVREKVRETLEYCERVLCVSERLAARAERVTDPSKVTVLPLGADPRRFPVDCESRLRAELDVDPEVPVILFIGRYEKAKGTRELGSAIRNLDAENVHVVCIGQRGDQRWSLTEELGETSYPTHVFGGRSPLAVRRWFAVADVLVLPSYREGRPTVIYEAMASNTCVLATDVGGVPEQVVDGETGVLIPPRDAKALRDALDELVADMDRTRRMAERGYDRLLEKNWTWDGHAERLADVHRSAISEA